MGVRRGDAPLILAFPHGGIELAGLDDQFVSPWRAQLDTDWWIAELYAFAAEIATVRDRVREPAAGHAGVTAARGSVRGETGVSGSVILSES